MPVIAVIAVEAAMAVHAGRSTVDGGWDVLACLVEELRSLWPPDLSTENLPDGARR
jgi:hypothetical protein